MTKFWGEVMTNSITHFGNGGVSFSGPKAVNVYVCAALALALEMYAKHGIKVNRAYTPKNMIAAAERETGLKFKPRDYLGAAKALRETKDKFLAEVQKEMQS
jgi:hypothetical protein